ncbi:MAG: hypothetical protein LQ341_003597, partial [Variospora aurantia]
MPPSIDYLLRSKPSRSPSIACSLSATSPSSFLTPRSSASPSVRTHSSLAPISLLYFPYLVPTKSPALLTALLGYNILYSALLPLIILTLITTLLSPSQSPNRLHKAHVTILGLLISLLLTSFLTDTFKNAIGRPRPDLLARCKPAK